MATSVIDSRRGGLTALLGLLAPRPGRLKFAILLALICALTVLVAEIYQTPEPALTVYIAFFLNRPDRTTSVIMNIALTVVISVLLGFVIVVAMMVADDAMWRVISIATISFGLLFLASASKLRPIGSSLALIAGYALDVLGMIQLGEEATRGLLYTALFVGMPAGVSLVVNLLLAPAPRRLAESALALRLQLSAAMLRGPDEDKRRRFGECLREGAGPILEYLKLAGIERSMDSQDIAALRQAAYSCVSLLSAIDVADLNPDATLPAVLREPVARLLEEMADVLTAGGYPLKIGLEMPAENVTFSPLGGEAFANIKSAILRFAEPPEDDTPPPKEASGGFFEKDAFSNPDYVRYALKTTCAAVFCYVLYSLLDWPGIHTCFITCYIVSLGTAAESVEKLFLRIAGCLVGAAAGYAAIVYLVPSLTSIGGLMATVFLGALASAYVAAGSPRISYAGFQMAFAFFLCVIQGSGPSFDLKIARDRVIGILLGNLVVYVLFTHLWPVSVSRRIDPTIAAALKRLSALALVGNLRERRALASEVQVTLATLETDIDLALYEPPTIRPDQRALATRLNAAREMSVLDRLLLLEAGKEAGFRDAIAHRLDALAGRLEGAGEDLSPQTAKRAPAADVPPLHAIVDQQVRRLEDAVTGMTATIEQGRANHAA